MRKFNLVLIRDLHLFADALEFDTSSGFHPNNFYEGYVKGVEGSKVHGFVYDDVFEGRIYLSYGVEFHIESSHNYKHLKNCHSIIYDAKHVIHPKQEFCKGIDESLYLKNGSYSNKSEDSKELESNGSSPKAHHREKRSTRFHTSRKECQLYMRADYTYSEWVGGDAKALLRLASHVKAVSHIYEKIDFNGDYSQDGISFKIKKLEIVQKCLNGESTTECQFSKPIENAEKFLNLASTGDFESYCLSYMLTHRDFGGTIGIAYVGSLLTGNGICGKSKFVHGKRVTRNVGIVTTQTAGRDYVGKVTDISLAHEIGHNFGAQHDSDWKPLCSPGGTSGNYIMYPYVSSGNYPNSMLFSPCSIEKMWKVIQQVGGCFSVKDISICGNKIVEGSEQCDCGYEDEESCRKDKCCNGRAFWSSRKGCTYSKKANEVLHESNRCSPSNGRCCNTATCRAFMSSENICSEKTDCTQETHCLPFRKQCPLPSKAADLSLCDYASHICLNGTCSGSICKRLGWPECVCPIRFGVDVICCESFGSCNPVKPSQYMPQATCGGTYERKKGRITSPNYPLGYNNNQICKYSIRAPAGKVIRFQLLVAKLESGSCKYDYLSFYDNGIPIGQYCKSGNIVYTRGNNLEIYFITDQSVTAKGFIGQWNVCDPTDELSPDSCLQFNKFTTNEGTLSSPNYPSYYQKRLHVNYTILLKKHRTIKFEITDANFEIHESKYEESTCLKDYIMLNYGKSIFGKKYCSKAIISVPTNKLDIAFVTDAYGKAKGFKAKWSSAETVSCYESFDSEYGRIKSPNYPSKNKNNLKCKYIIKVPRGKRIRFEIADAQLYNWGSKTCHYDYLKFKDRLGYHLGTYCRTGNMVYTRSNYLEIDFVTDNFYTARGFLGKWNSCTDNDSDNEGSSCVPALSYTSNSGTITSPNYPLNSQRNLNIVYKVTAPVGKIIRFRIIKADFGSLSCVYDYLLIKEKSKILGKYCRAATIYTTTNELSINFVTTLYGSNEGFKGEWTALDSGTPTITTIETTSTKIGTCGGRFYKDSGDIASPNYPKSVINEMSCRYFIHVSKGKTITLELSQAKFESTSCQYDYLTFEENQLYLGKYCQTGNVIYSKGNTLSVIIPRDRNFFHRHAFYARWHACDGNKIFHNGLCVHALSYNNNSGIITSPNYPLDYQNNLNIAYHITVAAGKRIRFRIISAHFSSSSCLSDYLIFKEKSKHLGRYCRTATIYTIANELTITFITDSIGTDMGFRGEWVALDSAFVEPKKNFDRVSRKSSILKIVSIPLVPIILLVVLLFVCRIIKNQKKHINNDRVENTVNMNVDQAVNDVEDNSQTINSENNYEISHALLKQESNNQLIHSIQNDEGSRGFDEKINSSNAFVNPTYEEMSKESVRKSEKAAVQSNSFEAI